MRTVRREDIERYRQVLEQLGGEASLEEIAEHTGKREPDTDLGYVAACLIVPAPTQRDPSIVLPFALPSAWDRDRHGRQTWRTERHWTAEDLKEGQRFLWPGTDADDDNG